MELFATLAGNDKIKKTLAHDILNGTNSHAYIIEGAKGSGKHTVAYTAAAALCCENKKSSEFPCGKCSACRKTFEKINTDITLISKESKSTVGVDSIRTIKETLKLAPIEMKRKVFIIEDADKMTKNAQNALLLSLEEPPEYVVFFLLCEDASALLETVKSRAPVIRCENFSKDFIKNYLSNDSNFSKISRDKPKEFDEACAAACGSIGMAKYYLTPKESKVIHEKRERVSNAVKSLCYGTQTEKIQSISLYPSSRSELSDFLKTVQLAIRDLLYIKKGTGGDLLFYTNEEDARPVAAKTKIKRLSALQTNLSRAICDINLNLNFSAVLTLLITD